MRERRRNPTIKKEFLLESISTTKIIEIGVKLFLLMKRALIRVFFYLEIVKKNTYHLGKIFYFGLILGFRTVLWVF